MLITIGIIRRTLAAVGLAALSLSLSSQGLLSASGSEPSAPEGPFAENFTFSDPPVPAPSVAFQTLGGEVATLADFRGQVVLVNFWATWCAPCVREMPSLQRLHQELADEGLTVLAVSEDRAGAAVVRPFLKRLELFGLPIYLDSKGLLARAFVVKGLPTSFLIDRQGQVVAGLVGPMEWDSQEAKALIRNYLQQEIPLKNTSG